MTTRVSVTPVVLTFNEAPNIGRTLDSLGWASRVVVLDSGSTDDTERIARQHPNVEWHTRPFDRHDAQWAFAVGCASAGDGYVLALDADHQVPPDFVAELETSFLPGGYAGAVAGFEYRLLGRSIGRALYPPKVVLFKPGALIIKQPGHTQEFSLAGAQYQFRSRLVHDDRKPIDRFAASQARYVQLEAERLLARRDLRWSDRLRLTGLMPLIAAPVAFLRAGGPFGGAAAARYAYERATFECLLAIALMTAKLGARERR
jgi:glycosyltransferase involved in cell wall biosynthesis